MQILVDFENGGTWQCINRYLLDAMYSIQLILIQSYGLMTWFPTYGTKQNCEIALKKTDENIVAGWNIWLVYMNNIYWCDLSW